jgi:hypothetical protein
MARCANQAFHFWQAISSLFLIDGFHRQVNRLRKLQELVEDECAVIHSRSVIPQATA